jgi:hypothetical protein
MVRLPCAMYINPEGTIEVEREDSMKETESRIQEEIEEAAESIFSALYHEGDMRFDELQQKIPWKSPVFDWALGWLVGKEDVIVTPGNGSFCLRRAAPARAVFPLRGN